MAVRPSPAGGIAIGPARVDRRTKNLVKRLQPGDIAVIDHEDLDRIAAENLVAARPGAVVNTARSISGRYPNVGPLLLAAAGIPLVDNVGPDVMDVVSDGQVLRVEGDEVWTGEECVAKGTRQTMDSLEEAFDAAKATISVELERFAENTMEYMRQERHLLTDSPDLPELDVDVRGRHVLVVVRGHDYREDLAALAWYVREVRPVLVGVDGGADALLEAGYRPDLIIGDFDSVSTEALCSGAQLVVHAYAGGTAPGAARLDRLGLGYAVAEAAGTSEDLALLLAYEKGAELIVAVGTHSSLVDFLDKGRAGMASTFLVRLKVGPMLVDAKGVSRLYQTRLRKRDMTLLVVSALLAMIAVTAASESLQLFFESLWETLADAWPG
jgi:uncharacterized membrane-anchored protein